MSFTSYEAYEPRNFLPHREVWPKLLKGFIITVMTSVPEKSENTAPNYCATVYFACSLMYLCVSLTLACLLQRPSNLNFKDMSVAISSRCGA